MIVFSNAKINLGLFVTDKRPDGFHNLATCFYPVDWSDVLEINESKELTFESFGIPIPGDPSDNLCLKAYHLLKKDFDIPPVSIHLIKNIPIGAGLGGGSSNSSFTLKALNDLFQLNIADDELAKYAAKLGSDCPFFIYNKAKLAFGTGNQFKDIDLSLTGKKILLVYPNIHISTAQAFSNIRVMQPKMPIADILQEPLKKWKENLNNDFELSVFNVNEDIKKLKDKMYQSGAEFSLMSGSGSTVYGIFDQDFDFEELESYCSEKKYAYINIKISR